MSPYDIAGHPKMRYNTIVKKDYYQKNQLNSTPQPASAGFFNASFLMIPKALLYGGRFSEMSLCAKILYALMKDRLSLSEKNGWRDTSGRTFIYFTQLDAAKILGCGKKSVTKYTRELENLGLIQKTAQGLCRPDIIYVNDIPEPRESACESPENDTSEEHGTEGFLPEGAESASPDTQNLPLGSAKNAPPEAQNLRSNNTEKSNTEINHTEEG